MAFSHVTNSRAGREKEEAVTANLFKAYLIPENTNFTGFEIITEAILNVTGWVIPGPDAIQQNFQTSKRNRPGAEVDTTQNITVTLELNLSKDNEFYIYKKILELHQAVFNQATGEYGLYKDILFKFVVENTNKIGDIFWTRTLHNAWISGGLEGIADVDYTSPDPIQLSFTVTADYYTEELV